MIFLNMGNNTFQALKIEKSYRCPKFDGDAKQNLEIRVERKKNNRSKFSRENEGGYFKLPKMFFPQITSLE